MVSQEELAGMSTAVNESTFLIEGCFVGVTDDEIFF